jgi:hypothetical protein
LGDLAESNTEFGFFRETLMSGLLARAFGSEPLEQHLGNTSATCGSKMNDPPAYLKHQKLSAKEIYART